MSQPVHSPLDQALIHRSADQINVLTSSGIVLPLALVTDLREMVDRLRLEANRAHHGETRRSDEAAKIIDGLLGPNAKSAVDAALAWLRTHDHPGLKLSETTRLFMAQHAKDHPE